MMVNYNIKDRKPFVKALEEITGAKAKYLYTPSYAFEVGIFTVTREVTLPMYEAVNTADVERVLEDLAEKGYHAEQPEGTGLTITLPADCVNIDNLNNLLVAKGSLIKNALGIASLPIEVTEDKVSFPWFATMPESDKATAYTQLISALCKMSKEQKRILAKEKPVDNEKYSFRCFLLRLGFIGDEYKTTRKILLQNLSGNGAWKAK